VADEAKSLIKKALEENTETAGPMEVTHALPSHKRKRSICKSSARKPKSTLDEFKILKIASEAAVKAAIAAERNPAVLKAAAILLAAKRRTAYRETTRKANSLFKRTSTYVCRLVGPGNTIILPPVNFANWFQGLSGGSTTSYMQTIGLAGGIDRLYKTAARFGINVVACNECYTSRECSNCRDCDFRGSGRTFTCSSCGLITHRDAGNSVVNIVIRALALGYDVDQALFNATATDGAAASAAAAYAADAGDGIDE